MDAIAGMQATGRRVQGPGFELAGLDGDRGVHTAIVLGGARRTDADLVVREGVRAFLERPGFAGLARLVAVDRAAGAVVFATGEVWSAAEAIASLRRRGRSPGLRAGLELAWQAAELLSRAHKEAGPLGAACHGAIDPWRVALRRDGQVVLLGYDVVPGRLGLSTEGAVLAEALRYAPPERVEGRAEDATSDLFSLALVALEWIVGEPVYAGTLDQIRESAREADGDRVMWAWRDRVPQSVATVLGRAIRRDADARWPDAASLAAALRQELGAPGVEGPSLHVLLGSKDVDPPTRFVALDEERGDADRSRGAEPVADVGGETVRPARSRIVSLGGRTGRVARVVGAGPQIPAAVFIAPTPPVAVDVRALMVPEEDMDAPPIASTHADVASEVASPDDVPTVEQPRPEAETNGETRWEAAGPIELVASTPDEVDVSLTVAAELPASRVALELAMAAGLARHDANGRLIAVWRLTSDGAPVADDVHAGSLSRGVLRLTRGDVRSVAVRVRVGARVVEASVSTALFASEAAAALAGVGGLSRGRSLSIDGAAIDADMLLDGRVRAGSTLEIVP